MRVQTRFANIVLLAVAGAAALTLAGCVGATDGPPAGAEVIENPAVAPVNVNPQQAAALLSAMRADQGLPPVGVSATLNAIAQDYANTLAAAGEVSHRLDGTLGSRLADGGYLWVVAGENLGGGYRSLEEAFERWNASPSHRANLLSPAVTEIGIATAFNAASPFRTFWVLLLARPPAPI